MSEFEERPYGVLELREDGTYTKHPVRFHNVNGKIFKEDLTTKEVQSVPPSVLLTVDDVTGEIEGEQRGFVLDHQFNNPVHPTEGKKYLRVADSEIPVDFKDADKIIVYKVSKAGQLVKK